MSVRPYKHITARERDNLALLHSRGVGIREIARVLGRSPSSISEEVKRNSFKSKYYVAIHAHTKAQERKTAARARHPLKDSHRYSYVIDKLKAGWSPEVIAGRLKKKHGRSVICHETIYAFCHSGHPEAKRLKLWQYLPRGHKRRRDKKGRKVRRERIEARVSIHARPILVEARAQAGHWEGDSMEGKAHQQGLHVEVERVTRLILARKIEKLGAEETLCAQVDIFSKIPTQLRKTITLDNGLENTKHMYLFDLGIKTFFTDPYSAWQKGSVENAIGLIRRYLPKGTDLREITQEDINDILWEINNRPRKVLDYSTPIEAFRTYLNT